jgi:prepilin-type N-terminal cleavage/methylation domain-containing protein
MKAPETVHARHGVTLVELLIVLVLLGILASVTTLATRAAERPDPSDPLTVIADSLRASVASGRTIAVRMMIHDQSAAATVRPGGSVDADSAYGIDPLTGRPSDAR